MIRKEFLFLILAFVSSFCFAQSLTNEGALISLQENALIYSEGSILNVGEGKIIGNGNVNFSSMSNTMNISPGFEIGQLNINSSLINTETSNITIEIAGNEGIGLVNGNDNVNVVGDLTLNGKLTVTSMNYTPSLGDEFVIMNYSGTLTGQFTSFDFDNDFTIDYSTLGVVKLLYTGTLSVADFSLGEIAIYPNPASDIITIKTSDKVKKVQVYNLLGVKVLELKNQDSISLKQLPVGTYLLKIETTNGKMEVKKVIKT